MLQAAGPRDYIEQYAADASLFSRHWDITGDSKAAMDREQKVLEGWMQKLKALDFASLSQASQIDFILLRNELEVSLMRLADRREKAHELNPWLDFRKAIDGLTEARAHGEPVNAEKAATALAPLAKAITDLQNKLKAAKDKKPAPPPAAAAAPAKEAPKDKAADVAAAAVAPAAAPAATGAGAGAASPSAPSPQLPTAHQALLAAETVDTLAGSLKAWQTNYQGFLPDFSWWVKQPYDEAAKALEGYGKFLREELAGVKNKDDAPLLGKAIGAIDLQEQLEHEFIPYTPDELVKIAEREFAWCEGEMKKAAGEMNLGDDWKKALLRVKLQYVRPGEQETFVRDEGKRAIEFVTKRDLVTVPADCAEWWGTRMLSPQEQKSIPYAAYSGHDMLVAYANEGMKVGSSRVDLQACKLEYSIVSPK